MTVLTVPEGPHLFVLNFGGMLLCFGLLEYRKSHRVPVGLESFHARSLHIFQLTDLKIAPFSSCCFKVLSLIAEIECDSLF